MPCYYYECSKCDATMTRYGIPVKERNDAPNCECGGDMVLQIQPVETTYNKKGKTTK